MFIHPFGVRAATHHCRGCIWPVIQGGRAPTTTVGSAVFSPRSACDPQASPSTFRSIRVCASSPYPIYQPVSPSAVTVDAAATAARDLRRPQRIGNAARRGATAAKHLSAMLLLASTRCFLLTACVVRRTGCTLYGLLSRLAHWTTAVRRAGTFWCVAGGCRVTTVTTHHYHHRHTSFWSTVRCDATHAPYPSIARAVFFRLQQRDTHPSSCGTPTHMLHPPRNQSS